MIEQIELDVLISVQGSRGTATLRQAFPKNTPLINNCVRRKESGKTGSGDFQA